MKKSVYIISFCLIFGITGCRQSYKQSDSTSVRVKIAHAQAKSDLSQQYIGRIESSAVIPLSFPVTGVICEMNVEEGDRVVKGQLLASLDTISYYHALSIALATEKRALDAWERLSGLYEKGSLPEIRYIEAKTSVDQAKATVELARKNLTDCYMRAPGNGVIGEKMA